MSTIQFDVKLAIRRVGRHPYYSTRVLGPRAKPHADEVVLPLDVRLDSAWFNRRTLTTRLDLSSVQPPPLVSSEGPE